MRALRLKFVGRDVFLALRYNPQALQIIKPEGDLRQRGVVEVSQLLFAFHQLVFLNTKTNARGTETFKGD